MTHPAWSIFLQTHFPATQQEKPEFLTTMQILERLNTMINNDHTTEGEVFSQLQIAGFVYLSPPPVGIILWMVKSTPMKMISVTGPAEE